MKQNYLIADSKLRKHACRKFAKILESKNLPKRKAQIEALSLEENIRKMHPEMGAEYIKDCKVLIKNLKETQKY